MPECAPNRGNISVNFSNIRGDIHENRIAFYKNDADFADIHKNITERHAVFLNINEDIQKNGLIIIKN